MKLNYWTINPQDTSCYPLKFGTITATSRWYGDSEEEQDWSAWIENNPPVIRKSRTCAFNEHQWADTGLAKTWCKKCDLSGRWVLGNVEIEHEPK
jgi:hypothetical protein